jgi:hypothetical protein
MIFLSHNLKEDVLRAAGDPTTKKVNWKLPATCVVTARGYDTPSEEIITITLKEYTKLIDRIARLEEKLNNSHICLVKGCRLKNRKLGG